MEMEELLFLISEISSGFDMANWESWSAFYWAVELRGIN